MSGFLCFLNTIDIYLFIDFIFSNVMMEVYYYMAVYAMKKLILFLLLLAIVPVVAAISGNTQDRQIRTEIYEFVTENKDFIDLNNPEHIQYFEYYEWGFVDSGVIYGYFYSPDNQCVSYGSKYRKGYRSEGSPNYGNGWVYFEQICDHWYYYEEHYG